MKHLVIVVFCVSVVIGGELARADIKAELDRYAAEMAADQMETEGSAEYEVYRKTAETMYTVISVSEAAACCVPALCVVRKIKEYKNDKE